jgi:hypothetical protein
VPDSLRDWDPGVDSFGVPWLSITRHPDTIRDALKARAEQSPLLRGRHGFGADPNVKSFYDVYLARTGCVVDIGRGWSQRMYDGPGRTIRKQQSVRDRLWQAELGRIAQQPNVTTDLIRVHLAQCKERWLADPQHPYRVVQDAIDAAWEGVRKGQARLHEVTCIFMAAFDDRVLPWLDTAQLLREKGVGALSHSAKLRLQFLAHGAFRQRLISHCGDPCHASNCIVWTTEEYSSKLCGRCFRYCGYLGNERTFKCPHCHAHMDRDGNAARNIWMWAWLRARRRVLDREEEAKKDFETIETSETTDKTKHKHKRQKTSIGGVGGRGTRSQVQLPSCTLTPVGVKALLASCA